MIRMIRESITFLAMEIKEFSRKYLLMFSQTLPDQKKYVMHLDRSGISIRWKKSKKSTAVAQKMLFWLLGWKTYLRTIQYPNLSLKNLCIMSEIFAAPAIPLSILYFLLSWNVVFCLFLTGIVPQKLDFPLTSIFRISMGHSLKEDTIEVLRVVRDAILGHPSLLVTKEMFRSVKASRQRYEVDLEAKSLLLEKNAARKRRRAKGKR